MNFTIEAVILAAVRSPIGKAYKGSLIHTRIDDLGAQVVQGLLKKIPSLDPNLIEDLLLGCAMPEGEQGLNLARNLGFLAGLPLTTAGVTINRFCASSLEAINQAALALSTGNGEAFIAGGVESMTHVPMGGFNPSLNERLLQTGAPKAYMSMGLTAENLAEEYKISREEQDSFALASHQKALAARAVFKNEIIPIKALSADGASFQVEQDEGPRTDSTLESLAKLEPAFKKNGTVTAGNASQISDGAAMVLLTTQALAKKIGVKPLAKICSLAVTGVEPHRMGLGPVPAVPKALKRAGLKLADIGLVELNEAFAAQTLAVIRQLKLNEEIVNVHGGAIALGHPLGASGARLIATLLNAMQNRKVSLGLATLCVGGGQGVATIIEQY